MGSGSGRLLKKLVTINPNITGVELAQPMIDNCKKILPNAKVIHANVLDLNLDQKFDLIIAPYRFISHFDKSGLGKLFQVVAKHLISGGKYIGDIFSPQQNININCELSWMEVNGDILERDYNTYDHVNQICSEYVEKVNLLTKDITIIKTPWHYFFPKQILEAATQAGFKGNCLYDNFQKDPYTGTQDDLIYEFTL